MDLESVVSRATTSGDRGLTRGHGPCWSCRVFSCSRLWLVMLLATAASKAGAVPPAAEMLFREGRQLMAAGNTAEACTRFEQSFALDSASGTLLNPRPLPREARKVRDRLGGVSGTQRPSPAIRTARIAPRRPRPGSRRSSRSWRASRCSPRIRRPASTSGPKRIDRARSALASPRRSIPASTTCAPRPRDGGPGRRPSRSRRPSSAPWRSPSSNRMRLPSHRSPRRLP